MVRKFKRVDYEEAGEFILTEGSLVSFDFTQPLDLDVRAVDAVASSVSADTSLDALQAGLERIQGEFLEGFSLPDAPDFETWASGQREWQHRLGETLFAEVVQRQMAQGNFFEAISTTTNWTHYAPLTETAYRHLIEAYALAGDRAAALQTYETCQKLLTAELGISPSTETAALAERVKQEEIGRALPDRLPPRPAADESPQPQPALVIPLVGRATEYSRLVTIYQQATQGNFQTVAIVGEAGLGKTRLADTFLDWATLEATPADVLRGRAFEIGGNLPYQPVVDALRLRLERENAPDDLLDDVWLAELSQLLPELRSRYPDLPPPMAGNADFVQARLFEAVAHLGAALAERQPLVLFIDDVQWADTGSRAMLHYLARRWSALETPALLLLTIRQEGLLTRPALREWLLGLGCDVPLTRLELAPLTRTDLSQLAQMLAADSESSAPLGDWLATETGGSPFFMAEMLRLLQQQALLVETIQADGRLAFDVPATMKRLHSTRRVPLPPTVRDLILTRLGRLSPTANALLLAGAVMGRQCSFERLCQVARIDEFEGLPALESLLNSRLMLETEAEARPFAFAHDNIRDVIYTEARATRRRLYHRQAFAVLEQDHAPPAELAFHASVAGLHQPAFTYAVAAGDNALALHAFAEAVNYYEQALTLTDRVDFNSAQLGHLCTHYGRSLELSGRYQAALDHYIEATANARQSGNKALELATLVAQGTIRSTANELSDFEVGEALGQEALALAPELGDKAAEAKIQWNLLNIYRMLGRTEQALTAGEQSLALATDLDLKEQMAYAANDLVYVYMALGDLSRTLALEKTATALWRALDNQPMLIDSLINLGSTHAFLGWYDAALTIATEASQISQSLENKWSQSYSLFTATIAHWRRMMVQDALRAMEASIQLAEEVGFTGAQAIIKSFQAQLLTALGAVDQARRLAQEARHMADTYIPLFSPVAITAQIMVRLKAGHLAEAAALLTDLTIDETTFDAMNYFFPEVAACHVALSQGDDQRAYCLSHNVLAFLREQQFRIYIPDFLYIQAQALIGLHRPDEARQALAAALDILRETGGRWHFWEMADLLAELEEQAGNAETATDLRHEARLTLEFIIDHIPEGELRASFVGLPGVAAIVAPGN